MKYFALGLVFMVLNQSCGLFVPKTILEKRKIEKNKRKKSGGDTTCPTYKCD